jgi:hypothetical protein
MLSKLFKRSTRFINSNLVRRSFNDNLSYLDRRDPNSVDDAEVNCLMLHPVGWPNHGPNIELYLAEEAIGLVKSLDWEVVKGPMWDSSIDQDDEANNSDDDDEIR